MCNFTPSEIRTRQEMSEETINAIGEMVHAAVKHFDPDHTGPVEFTACRPHPSEIDDANNEEFFYAQHSF